jgi:hypothetical protein
MKLSAMASLTAGLILATSGTASAGYIVDTYNSLTTTNTQATTLDFGSGPCGGYASCSGDFVFSSDSVSGERAKPANLGAEDIYLAVPTDLQEPISATFSLGFSANYFGLFWGSVDTYNTITFYLDGLLIASFGGDDIAPPADGNQTSDATNFYTDFFFTEGARFDTVTFSSTQFAFESANHAYAVPEPGTLGLLGLGLAGLGFAGRRRSR